MIMGGGNQIRAEWVQLYVWETSKCRSQAPSLKYPKTYFVHAEPGVEHAVMGSVGLCHLAVAYCRLKASELQPLSSTVDYSLLPDVLQQMTHQMEAKDWLP